MSTLPPPSTEGLPQPAHRPQIADVADAVGRHWQIGRLDLVSESRRIAVTRPRQFAMYLAEQVTGRSHRVIGRFFGGRDHTTVTHAANRVRQLMAEDRELARTLETMAEQLRATCGCSACVSHRRRFAMDPPQLVLPIWSPSELRLEQVAA